MSNTICFVGTIRGIEIANSVLCVLHFSVIPSLVVQHFFILFEVLRSLFADVDPGKYGCQARNIYYRLVLTNPSLHVYE